MGVWRARAVDLLPSAMARFPAPLDCPDLVAPLPASARLAAIALATVTTGAEREHRVAVRLTALAWPKAFNVIVRCFRPTNVHRFHDDRQRTRSLRRGMMVLPSASAEVQKTTFSGESTTRLEARQKTNVLECASPSCPH
jgi:hypothetical protein